MTEDQQRSERTDAGCTACSCSRQSTPAPNEVGAPVAMAAQSPDQGVSDTQKSLTSTLEFVSIGTMTRREAPISSEISQPEQGPSSTGAKRAFYVFMGLVIGICVGIVAIATSTTGVRELGTPAGLESAVETLTKAAPFVTDDDIDPGIIIVLPDVNDDNAITFPGNDPGIYIDSIRGLETDPNIRPVSR